MKIQLIRNATMKISYAGHKILTDPMLSPQGILPSFAGIAANPTVALPFSIETILADIEMTIISHLHPDHFDEAAALVLPKEMAIFCQPGDAGPLQEKGFIHATAAEPAKLWEGISITRSAGQHGKGKILERLGKVSGFVLRAPGEPTLYWVGDSIWYEEVAKTIVKHKPDIIITHSGGAALPGSGPIIMDGEQTLKVLAAAPWAVVVAVHMESLDHCSTSRAQLRSMAYSTSVSPSRLLIPEDGETLLL